MNNLGDLERSVMEELWRSDQALSVRVVHSRVTAERDLAYTTVMTVLDRLAKKKIVERQRDGRAWIYRPAQSREQMVAEVMHSALTDAEEDSSAALVAFVGRASDSELALLRQALADLEQGADLDRGSDSSA